MANWIDKIIGTISPKWGYYREAWTQSTEQLRNYDAGDYGRLNANWRPSNESAELTDLYNRDSKGESAGFGEKL